MAQIVDINVVRAAHTILCEMIAEKKKSEKRFEEFVKEYPELLEEQITEIRRLLGDDVPPNFRIIKGGLE